MTKTISEPVVSYIKKEIRSCKISSSQDCYDYLKGTYERIPDHVEREYFIVLVLDRGNNVVGEFIHSSGGTAGCIVDPKLLFRKAIQYTAMAGIILSHNHPSGQVSPSTNDLNLTDKIKKGGRFLDVLVLDHIIYTDNGYHSFADKGQI